MVTIPWFKIDDAFWSHPKTIMLSDSAQALWLRAGSWCAQYLTDGHVPNKIAPVLRLESAVAKELVEAGLWDEAHDGWTFHDWGEYQPLKADVEAERAAARERMRSRRRSPDGQFARSSENVRANTRRTFARSSENVRPPRPDPTRTSKEVPTEDTSHDHQFDTFWAAYPKKVDKGQARKAFKTAMKKTSLEDLVTATKQYAVSVQGKERQFIKNPATWLNAEAWENEDAQEPADTKPPTSYIWG